MTDEITTVEAGLKSALSADISATLATPLGPEALDTRLAAKRLNAGVRPRRVSREDRESDRIARMKALCGQSRKNTTELLLVAHRLGLEGTGTQLVAK